MTDLMDARATIPTLSLWLDAQPMVLASGSAIRAKMLGDAGVPLDVRASGLDERAVEATLTESGADPSHVAGALASAKAMQVSTFMPGRLVVGADQTLSLDGERFTKPFDRASAAAQLRRLSGKSHRLAAGAAIARDGAVLWSDVDHATLTMRPLSDAFIEAYLDAAGESVMTSVGGYQLEGLGAQLFETVDGDFRTILGLPLGPLLAALRDLGALRA